MAETETAEGSTHGSSALEAPPVGRLVIQVAGESSPRFFDLDGPVVRIGRAAESDVRIDLPWLSRQVVVLRRLHEQTSLEPVAGALTRVTHGGWNLSRPVELADSDFFRFEGDGPGEVVTLLFAAGTPGRLPTAARQVRPLAEGEVVTIGSAPESDIGGGSTTLEAQHASIGRDGGELWLEDLGSGVTLVNDRLVWDRTSLPPGSTVSAGDLRVRSTGDGIEYWSLRPGLVFADRRGRELPEDILLDAPRTGGVELVARGLTRTVGETTVLEDVSLRVRPRELVVLVGMSGAGKTTLLNALAGYRPADAGEVLIGGESLYRNRDRFRNSIGYVPQRDIVHAQLTVAEALDYAARLRLSAGTSAAERAERITEVLRDLGLEHKRGALVATLSGGQAKRVSIGVELISRPELLFLDEPTSGLDPATETGLMQLLRRLADQGRTIVVVTHATKNVLLADKVIFMVTGGRLAWFGPPAEALEYFDRHRPAAQQADRALEFDEIFSLLEDREVGDPADWRERYQADEASRRYLPGPDAGSPTTSAATAARATAPGRLRQLMVLSARNIRLLTRDRFALLLVVAAAPLLASLDFLITERRMFDPVLGDAARIVTNTNTIIVNAMLVGALAQMREIIKDRDIYRRERLVAVQLLPYLLSKFWLAGALATYQAVWWVGIRYLAVDMPGGWDVALGFYMTMVLATLAGMMLGLFASAVSPSEDAVALIVALLIVPQVLFSGAHLPAHEVSPLVRSQMDIMPSRWAFEALITLGGHGRDLARDVCWIDTTPAERAAMPAGERDACTCLGDGIATTCGYPGVRAQLVADESEGPAVPRETALLLAEGRLAVGHEAYGPVYDVSVATRWAALAAIITGLGVIIYGVQRLRDRSI